MQNFFPNIYLHCSNKALFGLFGELKFKNFELASKLKHCKPTRKQTARKFFLLRNPGTSYGKRLECALTGRFVPFIVFLFNVESKEKYFVILQQGVHHKNYISFTVFRYRLYILLISCCKFLRRSYFEIPFGTECIAREIF